MKVKQNEKTGDFVSNEIRKKPKKTTNLTEINNLPDKYFKALVITLTKLGERIDEGNNNFSEEV